jgi:hypothetical protein
LFSELGLGFRFRGLRTTLESAVVLSNEEQQQCLSHLISGWPST